MKVVIFWSSFFNIHTKLFFKLFFILDSCNNWIPLASYSIVTYFTVFPYLHQERLIKRHFNMIYFNITLLLFQKPFALEHGNTYETNANPKINILVSENIKQRWVNFSLEYFDALWWQCKVSKYSREKFSLFCPIFSEIQMFIFGLAFVLHFYLYHQFSIFQYSRHLRNSGKCA